MTSTSSKEFHTRTLGGLKSRFKISGCLIGNSIISLIFRKLGINPPKGVLLHGPPGTGKTLLAKAVANETQAHFISINSPSIMSKFVGEAEERIREVFKEAEKRSEERRVGKESRS